MPVRIPTYESRLTPSGMQSQRASAAEVSDAIGRGLQNLGQAAEGAAAHYSLFLQQKDDADAVANTGPQLAEANGYWANRLTTLAQSSRDGGIVQDKDGQSIGMTNQLQNEFQEWKTGFVGKIDNQKARQYAQQHLDTLWSSVYERSLNTEAKLGVENRSDKVDQSTAQYAQLASTDPSSADKSILAVKTQIANSGLDEHTRYIKALAAEKTIREAALTGAIQTNAADVKTAIDTHYAGGFNTAVEFTLKHEGGYSKADNNGAEVNFGINKAANPDVDVKNLTREGAKQIYKERYWDKIGGDELAKQNPALATAAFDTAVVAGVSKAKDLLSKSGGDVNKFLQLRQDFLNGLSAKDQKKYGGDVAKNWSSRNADLQTETASQSSPQMGVIRNIVSGIEPDRLNAFESAANTEVNRQQAVYRSQLTTTEGDHVAAYMNGQPVQKPLSEGEYIKAYGPIEGPQRYANYTAIAQLGTDISSMKLMPAAELDAMVASKDPSSQAGQPGYDLAVKRYDALLKARDAVVTARSSDPIAYAVTNKIADAAALPFNQPDKLNAALANRAGVAQTMQDKYQTPYTLLTKAEATTLNQGFQKMTTQQKLAYLNTFRTSLPNDKAYMSILQQIAPDSPVTAVAGNILSKNSSITVNHWFTQDEHYTPQDVAGTILEGEALINPTKAAQGQDGKGKTFPMPAESDLRLQFNNVVGKAFAGNPAAADTAYQAVKAYYAGKAARIGDVSGVANQDILKQSITAVLGGVSDVNGKGEVLRPWGMPEDVFKDNAQAAFTKAMSAAGMTGTSVDRFGLYGLQSAGGDRYLLVSGTGYLTDKQGKPIVLDMTQQANSLNMAMTSPATVTPDKKSIKPNTTRPKTK